MGAMAYRVRWWMRTQWRSFLGLTVLVGVVAGVGLLLVGGAARTLTAADRYSEARGDLYDVSIEQTSGHPRIAELLALPSVTRVDSATFVFGGLLGRGGEPYDILTFAGTHAAMGWRVVEGRAARTVGEAVVSRSFLEREGLSVGDEVDFVTFTQAQADAAGFDAPDPAGPSGRVRFVGALSGPEDLEDGFAVAILPAAVLAEGDVGVSASVMAAALAEGASIDMLRAEMDDLPGGSDFAIAPAEWVSDDVRSAARTQGQGLLVVSAVVGVAALVVAGQVLSRQLRPSDPEQVALTAIGFVHRDRLMEPTVRALAVAAPALVLAGAVAFAGSGTFPVGFVELLEPRPGLRFDAPVIVGGVLVALVALVGWVFVTAASESKRRPVVVEVGVVERISARVSSVALRTAIRFAIGRSGTRSRSRAPLAGMAATVAALFGAVTFDVSLDRLLDEPDRYGVVFDVGIGAGATELSDDILERVRTSADVAGVTAYGTTSVAVGSRTVDVVGMRPLRGDVVSHVQRGRLPINDDEIALGPAIADELGIDVGDEIRVRSVTGDRRLRVTGHVLAPPVNGADVIGEIALVSAAGLAALDPEAATSFLGIDLAAGARQERTRRLAELTGTNVGPADRPPVIVNLHRVRQLPLYVAAAMGALTMISLGHVLIVSVRRRRVDHAVLRALGATPRWVGGVVQWQASVTAVAVAVVALPVGIAAGQAAYRSVASSVGVPDDASVPLLALGVLLAPSVALANAVAALPARHSRRARPAELLRTD